MSTVAIYNPLSPGYVENPFSHFAEMRDGDPVHHSPLDMWVLFRYDDVAALLRDPSLSVSDDRLEVRNDERFERFLEAADGELRADTSILNVDPPDHTRLRKLVSKAFTPSAIQGLRPMIERRVEAILDGIAVRGRGDIVTELAFPLPFDVISEMLGMPPADKDLIAGWSAALVKTLDPIITDDEVREAVESGKRMDALLDDVIAWKRANPADDLLTALIDAEEDGDRLSPIELRDQVTLLFVAGHETTVNLIGTGLYELLSRPSQLARWRDDPTIDASAVDELLRFVSPVQLSRRITTREVEFDGRTIPAGRSVLAALASANRDPAKWGPTADELDLVRPGAAQHLSFGGGAHYCLGASLAKLEAQIAIGATLRRFSELRVSDEPVWNGRINLRGLDRLPVAV